jgi:radical SAM protein with 4Fe4S-binding SPASM domain
MATNNPHEFFIQWHLTERCNLWCKHCYQGERGTEELTLPEIKSVIAEVSAMLRDWSLTHGLVFSPSFNVTGGEPFLRSDLFDILEEIRKRDIDAFLLTNGTLVSGERARRLADLGISGVQVSIEGPEDVHNDIRGPGSFWAAAAGIEHLVDAGIPVTLNVTLSRLNAEHLNKIVAFGSHIGAKRIGFSRLVPYGRGSHLISRMMSSEQVRELYETLLSLELKGTELVPNDPLAAQIKTAPKDDAGDVAVSGCAAGVSGLTIHPNGNISPCRRMPVSLGNVKEDSLREIWSASPVLEALRDRSKYTGKCGACSQWARCRGCRAIAYAWSRSRGEDSYLADDPQCFIA